MPCTSPAAALQRNETGLFRNKECKISADGLDLRQRCKQGKDAKGRRPHAEMNAVWVTFYTGFFDDAGNIYGEQVRNQTFSLCFTRVLTSFTF